jgi:hybrid cluster-associated redox disulfide protein
MVKMKSKKKIEKKTEKLGNSNQKITEEMTFYDVITKFPETNTVFMKHEMFCAMGCPAAQQETIREGAQVHGIDVKKLIKELNNAVK